MRLELMDHNVSTTMNAFIIIANVINLVYNIPQMIKTYKTKSTCDFSGWFLSLRVVGNIIWVAYAIEIQSILMLINNSVTVLASLFICYYKVLEMRKQRTNSYNIVHDTHEDNTVITLTSIE